MIEVIRDEHDRLFVIEGDNSRGYYIHRVNTQPIARYENVDDAEAAITHGYLEVLS